MLGRELFHKAVKMRSGKNGECRRIPGWHEVTLSF
jgi:hypothetical protein